MRKKALVALHDVAPFHLSRLGEAEKWLVRWGITRINYLYVPDYHHQREKQSENRLGNFFDWVRQDRPFQIDWILHGLHHERAPGSLKRGMSLRRLRGLIWTDKEAEFQELSRPEIRRRVETGLGIFKNDIGFAPRMFVSPAWLHDKQLNDVLQEMKFDLTEDHRSVTDLRSGRRYDAPVITWAARSPFRRLLSRTGCRILARFWSKKDLIRIALHPPDFEHPSIIRSIRRIIGSVLAERELVLYRDMSEVTDSEKAPMDS
jgi:predicted deacetylase